MIVRRKSVLSRNRLVRGSLKDRHDKLEAFQKLVPPSSPGEECEDMDVDALPMVDDQDPPMQAPPSKEPAASEQPPLPVQTQIQPPVATPLVEPVSLPIPVPAPAPDEVCPEETPKVVQIQHSEVKILKREAKPQEAKPAPLELDHKSIQTDVVADPKPILDKPPAQPRAKPTVHQDCKALQTDPPVIRILARKHLAEDKQVTAHIKPEMRQVTAIPKPEVRQETALPSPEASQVPVKPEPKPEVKLPEVAPPKYMEAKSVQPEPQTPTKAPANPPKSVRSGTIRV